MIIAERLKIPEESKAILWDMDGVLLDTLGLDLILCNQLLNKYLGKNINLSKEYIQSIFAFHPPEFWRLIFEFIESEYGISDAKQHLYDEILNTYNNTRNNSAFEVNAGVIQILNTCKKKKLRLAVVSNNPTEDIKIILSRAGILDYFDIIVGNDLENVKKKPAPDTYIHAAQLLKIKPEHCVVIEDSLLGVEAGYNANCFTIGVATGGDKFELLEQSQWPKQVYSSFKPNHLSMQFGNVTNKHIYTPNEFVSHMIEHIAWRMGCGIDLYWNNNDWLQLGETIGSFILKFPNREKNGVALGMIDDGSAEVYIELCDNPELKIESTKLLDLNWFLSLRCEQIISGKPLIKLIEGITNGLMAKMHIRICSVEDPHHTWEGVFRSIGIALSHMFTPQPTLSFFDEHNPEKDLIKEGLIVESLSVNSARVSRKTAESNVCVSIDFNKRNPSKYIFKVSSSINVSGFQDILESFSKEAGFTVEITFDATVLNSSHVVVEDTALVLGRALKEIFILRMKHYGIEGAGSSVKSSEDIKNQSVSVGVSVEGRKFWKIVPFNETYNDFKKTFVIGQNISNNLFSEDLDDFIDGLAGGFDCSIIIHVRKPIEADEGWKMIFSNLGKALKEVFQANPYRKGVPPGVKATIY